MEKKFKKNSSYTTWGIISLVLGIPGLFLKGVGFALIVIGIIQLTQPGFPLQFFSNYFTFKATSLAPLKNVKFSEITNIEYSGSKIVITYLQGKKIRIGRGLFMSNDWNEIINAFKQIKP
mgnify:CR=1 FL=1